MTMPSIPRTLLLGMNLVFLVAAGCKAPQEPAPPMKPAMVRKRIELPQPVTIQAVKPSDQEAAAPVTEKGPPKKEAPELTAVELAEVKPSAEEARTPQVTAKPDKEAEIVAGPSSEHPSAVEMPPSGTFTIILASFRQRQRADGYVEELKKLGIHAYNWEVNLPEKGRWNRVSLGGFPTLKEAKKHAKQLGQEGISYSFITKITGSS